MDKMLVGGVRTGESGRVVCRAVLHLGLAIRIFIHRLRSCAEELHVWLSAVCYAGYRTA